MRIFLHPSYYLENVMSASGNRSALALGRRLAERGHLVHVLLPEDTSGVPGARKWVLNMEKIEEMGGHPNVRFVKSPAVRIDYQICTMTPEMVVMVDQNRAPFVYDAILSFSPSQSLAIRRIQDAAYGARFGSLVELPHVCVQDDIPVKGRSHHKSRWSLMLEVIGGLCDFLFFSNPMEQRDFMKEVRKLVQFGIVKELMEKSEVLGSSLDLDPFFALARRRREKERGPEDPVVVFYGGGLTSKKHVLESVEMVDRAYRAGKNVRMIVTTGMDPGEETDSWLKRFPFLEIHFKLDGDAYREYLLEGDMFICLSDMEGTGAGWLEMVASGLVGLYRWLPWLEGRTPEDYPYRALDGSFDQTEAVFRTMIEDWPATTARHEAQEIEAWMRKTYDQEAVVDQVEGALQRMVDAVPLPAKWAMPLYETAGIAEQDAWEMEDLCKALTAASEKGIKFGPKGTVGSFVVRRQMRELGFRDVGGLDSVRFKRS